MAEELVKKKRVQGGHRRSLKKSLQQVETIIADKTDNSKLPVLKITLKEKLEKLSTLDQEIADLMDDDDTVAEDMEEADEYKQKIHAAINSIDGALVPPAIPAPTVVTPGVPARADPLPSGPAPRVRLPKLIIQPFEGDITKWTSFWDSYNSAIHTNSALSGVDKFNYLRSYRFDTN